MIARTRKNLDFVNRVGFRLHAINLDDGHGVTVDGKIVVGIT
jgi:hypothetical protein